MPNNNATYSTTLLTALHCCVDALCACCVYMLAPALGLAASMWLFIAYNCLAFVTQPLVGWWIDGRCESHRQLWFATLLLGTGAGIAWFSSLLQHAVLPFVAVTCIGLGNSLFHVFGGRHVALHTGNDIRHLGIFVSSGALGLALGGEYSSSPAVGIITATLLLLTWHYTRSAAIVASRPVSAPVQAGHLRWLIAFVAFIVFIRSFIGNMTPPQFDQVAGYSLLLTCAAIVGKACGGFIVPRGQQWTVLTLLLLTVGILFLLGAQHDAWLLAMVLLINATMPLTLHLVNQLMPGRQGLAFGLLAAVLPLGTGLALLCGLDSLPHLLLYPLLATIVIEAAVLLSLHERRWQVLAMSVMMNIVTNLALNYYVQCVLDAPLTVPLILWLEGIVFVTEALLYYSVLRQWRVSLRYSLLCNAASYALGLAYELLFNY